MRYQNGDLYVPYLFEDGDLVILYWYWVGYDFHGTSLLSATQVST